MQVWFALLDRGKQVVDLCSVLPLRALVIFNLLQQVLYS